VFGRALLSRDVRCPGGTSRPADLFNLRRREEPRGLFHSHLDGSRAVHHIGFAVDNQERPLNGFASIASQVCKFLHVRILLPVGLNEVCTVEESHRCCHACISLEYSCNTLLSFRSEDLSGVKVWKDRSYGLAYGRSFTRTEGALLNEKVRIGRDGNGSELTRNMSGGGLLCDRPCCSPSLRVTDTTKCLESSGKAVLAALIELNNVASLARRRQVFGHDRRFRCICWDAEPSVVRRDHYIALECELIRGREMLP